jgi:RecJ-like exonuclease
MINRPWGKPEVDEVVCRICKGSGSDKIHVSQMCYFCHGHGKVTWIENVFGKDNLELKFSKESTNEIIRKALEDWIKMEKSYWKEKDNKC